MNMAEAKEILTELANGEYHSIEYSLSDYGNGTGKQECTVYIHDKGSFKAAHWDTAIRELKDAIDGKERFSEGLVLSKKPESQQ